MTTWTEIEQRVTAELAELGDEGFLVLGEPQQPAERRGLLGRRTPPPNRFVQYAGLGEWIHGECVGSTLIGGSWELTPPQHEQILALGWLTPDRPDERGTPPPAFPAYWRDEATPDAARLADMGVRALQVLGLAPTDLEWTRDT